MRIENETELYIKDQVIKVKKTDVFSFVLLIGKGALLSCLHFPVYINETHTEIGKTARLVLHVYCIS